MADRTHRAWCTLTARALCRPEEEQSKAACFGAVFGALVDALQRGADLDVARCALAHLDALNEKVNLYSNDAFRTQHALPLAGALLSLLADREHDTIRASLLGTLYALAVNDLEAFGSQVRVARPAAAPSTDRH